MTVTYTAKVATSSFSCFLRLLIRWRGSIYKLLWKDFLLFASAFFTLSLVYRFALDEDQKRIFEKVARYCDAHNNLIPVAFVLGFYISLVVGRWWDQFNHIPWPDRFALFVTANVHGLDERGRLMRRTMMRYLCLSYVITMSSISPAVKKRFPKFQHMAEAGFMMPNEQIIIEEVKTPHNKYFIPLAWCTSLVTRARKEGRIKDDHAVKTLIDEINEFRGKLGGLFNYDWISIPLVYTQVVTLAVYMFFISCLMSRQFVEQGGNTHDVYFPLFTFLQFLFYMGWLKVAECLVNPFGEDDDDFDINTVIDRNLQVSYLIVDEMHNEHPELIKDAYWDDVDFELPYTVAAESYRPSEPFLGSAMDIAVEKDKADFVPLQSVAEEKSLPTDIPLANHHRIHRGTPQNSILGRSPFSAFFKRSASRNVKHENLDSPSLRGGIRLKRLGSMGSHDMSGAPSPSTTMVTEDIFHMELEDQAEIDRLLEDALSGNDNPDGVINKLQRIALLRSRQRARSKSYLSQTDVAEKDSLVRSVSQLSDLAEETPANGVNNVKVTQGSTKQRSDSMSGKQRLSVPSRSISMGADSGFTTSKNDVTSPAEPTKV